MWKKQYVRNLSWEMLIDEYSFFKARILRINWDW